MNCIIVEDQPPAQRLLQKYIRDYGTLELKATFPDAVQATQFLQTEAIDIIFLDINLPKMSGMDFLKTLRQRPAVILTTAFSEYALESYELDVVDYLLKPFSFQRFVKAVTKAEEQQRLRTAQRAQPLIATSSEVGAAVEAPSHIFVKSGYEHHKVVIRKLLFIKADAEYTELMTAERKYVSNEPLKHWRESLGQQGFVQVHKSYLINLDKIVKIASNHIYLPGEHMIPIGRAYKEEFMERYVK
jgi:DNA-binding LytR/AlgR family response regulator